MIPLQISIALHYRSEIEECPDQDMSKMQAKLSIVPIDQLSLFIGKKVSVASTRHPDNQRLIHCWDPDMHSTVYSVCPHEPGLTLAVMQRVCVFSHPSMCHNMHNRS